MLSNPSRFLAPLIALGLLAVAPPRLHAQAANNGALLTRGKALWTNRGCVGCHAFGKKLAGPDLAGVEKRRTRAWLTGFLKDTDQMLATDATAKALLKDFGGVKMPNAKLVGPDADAILAYMQSEGSKVPKK